MINIKSHINKNKVFSYHWPRIKASPGVLKSRKDMLSVNSYNKNINCAGWLIAKCFKLLENKETTDC